MQEFRELSSRHDKLKKHLELIDSFKDEIVDAIEKQRWFRLANTSTVIFDRTTNLLWFDFTSGSHVFPYGTNKNKAPYSAIDNYAKAREMLALKNKHWMGNCMDWTIPTAEELWHLVEDKTFPLLRGDDRRIRWHRHWLTQSGCLDLDVGIDAVSDDDAYVIPCSHAYVPRTPKSTLEIFIDNQLDPIFHDSRISELYRRLYNPTAFPTIRRPELPPIEGFETSELMDYIACLKVQADETAERLERLRQHLNI